MTEAAVPHRNDQIEAWSSASLQSFQQRDNKRCIESADKILAAWLNADPAERERIRKPVLIGLKFGCLACFKVNDVERAMTFYEEALGAKRIFWGLGIRVAKHLARLGRREALMPVLGQLRAWAASNPERERELEALLQSIGGTDGLEPKPVLEKLTSTHFSKYPASMSHNDSALWLRAFSRATFVPTSSRFTVVINPKAACSTLKFNLWRQEYEMGATDLRPPKGRYIHVKRTAILKVPVTELERALLEKPVFSIVRNPYARILSAYLDKIAGNKKEKRHLLSSMGLVENVPIAFRDYIEFICGQNAQEMDAHYAPQVSLMQIDHVPYARIGCVEEMDDSIAAIMAAGYGIEPAAASNFRPHSTGAASLVARYYTADLVAKVRERFHEDFDRFGYSTDPADAHLPPRNLANVQSGRLAESVLRPVLRAAVAEKNGDYRASFEILSAVPSDALELDVIKARLLIELRRPEEAVGLLEGVVRRVPNVSHYWIMLAECLLALRHTDEAVRAADTAAFIAPSYGTLNRVVRILVAARERQKAKSYRARIAAIDALSFDRPVANRPRRQATRQNGLAAKPKRSIQSARMQ